MLERLQIAVMVLAFICLFFSLASMIKREIECWRARKHLDHALDMLYEELHRDEQEQEGQEWND